MKVKLISHSEPHGLLPDNIDDIQDLIAYCARVSNPTNQTNTESSEKLIRYLAKHKHWSPFEMVSVCLEIETTRDIARQILRHRSFSFQEFSQRYADPTKELAFVHREARLQDTANRQNSIETDDRELQKFWSEYQQDVLKAAYKAYEWAISNGIAKEQARSVLPEGLTVSRLYVNGTIRSWLHYCQIRMDPSTQKEHMDIAKACALEIAKVFPMITEYVQQQ